MHNLIFETLANLKYEEASLASRSLCRSFRSDSQIWLASRNFYGTKGRSSLMYVSARGFLKRMKFLIMETNVDVNACCSEGYSALCWSILSGQLESVKLLLRHGANASIVSKKNETPLILAIMEANLAIVKILLKNGCLTMGAWNSAIRLGRLEILDYFVSLDYKIEPDTFNIGVTKYYKQMTSLMWATKRSQQELMKHIIEKFLVEIDAQIESGETALFFAIREKDAESCKLLLDNGAKDLPKTDGFRSLMLATNLGQLEIVKLLIEHAFDLNLEDERGQCALFFAIQNENASILRLLCSSGCDLTNAMYYVARESFWETLLMAKIIVEFNGPIDSEAIEAAFSVKSFHLIEFFLEHGGIDVNIELENECTILSRACYFGSLNLVNKLLDTGEVTNFTNTLVFAATEGHYEIVKTLLSRYRMPKRELRNAFQASIGHPRVLEIICNHIKNINEPFQHGPYKNFTALMAVCKIGIPKSLEVLLGRGASEVHEIFPFYISDLGLIKSSLELCDRSIEGLECLKLLFNNGSFHIPKYDN